MKFPTISTRFSTNELALSFEIQLVGFLVIQKDGLLSIWTSVLFFVWIPLLPYKQVNIHSHTLPISWMSSCPTICEEEGSILFTVVYKGKIGGFTLENWLCQGKN
jgi:hypothetical protein